MHTCDCVQVCCVYGVFVSGWSVPVCCGGTFLLCLLLLVCGRRYNLVNPGPKVPQAIKSDIVSYIQYSDPVC
jgi:hypothetical protein